MAVYPALSLISWRHFLPPFQALNPRYSSLFHEILSISMFQFRLTPLFWPSQPSSLLWKTLGSSGSPTPKIGAVKSTTWRSKSSNWTKRKIGLSTTTRSLEASAKEAPRPESWKSRIDGEGLDVELDAPMRFSLLSLCKIPFS